MPPKRATRTIDQDDETNSATNQILELLRQQSTALAQHQQQIQHEMLLQQQQ